ncbi:hypothetical protein [Streptomyces sp. NBC_01803]|uniref:hypothetical protein n=1 Tax=Streptomyces sp. NBC_01803 TaxID=2975946 RepID=UPI002DDA9D72|nr:hypothetical protein [Streptomyces sp. NBC_01803]WSA47325.1 hypothetical protein OIE51_26030 [Streptomyces sp. NBC_01803]
MAAVRAAEAGLEKFLADDRAGFCAGRSATYRMPAKRDAEERLTAAGERLAALSGGAVDTSFPRLAGQVPDRHPRLWCCR